MKIGSLLQIVFQGKQNRCDACGEHFQCGPVLRGCWCSKVEVAVEVRRQLKEKYSSCLCPDCLRRATESAPFTKGPAQLPPESSGPIA